MKDTIFGFVPRLLVAALCFVSPLIAQQKEPESQSERAVIFAVLDGGTLIEPIASIDDGGDIGAPVGEGVDAKSFGNSYYRTGKRYRLVFGGVWDGEISVTRSNIGSECGGGTADVKASLSSARLAGSVMALATNIKLEKDATGFRRRPTATEKIEVDRLVRSEFKSEGASASMLSRLRYRNLTAVDIDSDDIPEFIGSSWLAASARERRLLFFIAERDRDGVLSISFRDYDTVTADNVMSGELRDVDSGIGHELLLDLIDTNNDGVKEVFTISRAFEGNNYSVHMRSAGKWTTVHELYSYRCAY